MTELLARKLSPTTVRYARGVLRRALNDGMREGVLNRNVAALARPPEWLRARCALSPLQKHRDSSAELQTTRWARFTRLLSGRAAGSANCSAWPGATWQQMVQR